MKGADYAQKILAISPKYCSTLSNEFIKEYLNRLHGETWDPIHPLLGDVLNETYGIMVYQEQVMQLSRILANFSKGESDILRKAIGKKKLDLMKKMEQ